MKNRMLEVGDVVITETMVGKREYPITRVTKTLAKSRRDASYEHTFKREIGFNMGHPSEKWTTTKYEVRRKTYSIKIMKILGLTDTVNVCDCCGKSGLARTVAIELAGGDVVYYGTTCASTRHGVKTSMRALSEISYYKSKAGSIAEFIKLMCGRGYGNVKILSPICGDVDFVTWCWGDVQVSAKHWLS